MGFAPKDTTYARDHDGLLLSMAQPGTPATYASNLLGRLVASTDAVTKTYTYDPQGRLAAITTSDGVTLTNTYDGALLAQQAVSGPFSHVVNKTYDNFFRVSSWNIDGVNPVAVTYNEDESVTAAGGLAVTRGTTGLLKSTSIGPVADTFSYSTYGELLGHAVAGGAIGYAATYERDAAGRIETKTETLGGTTRSERYTYDAAGRLWQVFVDGAASPEHEYAYDPNGNRDDGTYDAQDRLLAHAGLSYAYGPNGELARTTDNATLAETHYSYDAPGNLRSVARPVPEAPIDYVLDGENRRIGKKVGGALVQGFVYDGPRIVAELDAAGAVISRFIYATGGVTPDLMVKGGATYRFVKDHLGSPRILLDAATGAVAQRASTPGAPSPTTPPPASNPSASPAASGTPTPPSSASAPVTTIRPPGGGQRRTPRGLAAGGTFTRTRTTTLSTTSTRRGAIRSSSESGSQFYFIGYGSCSRPMTPRSRRRHTLRCTTTQLSALRRA